MLFFSATCFTDVIKKKERTPSSWKYYAYAYVLIFQMTVFQMTRCRAICLAFNADIQRSDVA